MNRLASLLLSLSLLAMAGTCFAQTSPLPQREVTNTNLQGDVPGPDGEAGTNAETDSDVLGDDNDAGQPTEAELDPLNNLELRMIELESRQPAANSGLLGIPIPLLLAGGSGLIGVIALVLSITAVLRVEKQRAAIEELNRRTQSLLTRLGGVEVQLEQERILNQNRAAQAERTATLSRPSATPTPAAPTQPIPKIIKEDSHSTPPAVPAPIALSKSALINALNSGDRQQLRDAATAELNITSDSESALAMGRSITTELEVVAGGGSYWLVMLQGEAWLFPTERTLNGFAASQPSKGLFRYEQQTIAKPQLLEPAALEGSGNRWSVKSTGCIGTP